MIGSFSQFMYGLPSRTFAPGAGTLRPLVCWTFVTAACGSFSNLPELFSEERTRCDKGGVCGSVGGVIRQGNLQIASVDISFLLSQISDTNGASIYVPRGDRAGGPCDLLGHPLL